MEEQISLFDTATGIMATIIQNKRANEDFSEYVEQSTGYMEQVEMKYSFPEQQAAGGVVVVSARVLLPLTTTPEKITLIPLFHQALNMISSFDKLPSFHWQHVRPLFQQYLEAIPKDSPGATKILNMLIKCLDVIKISNTIKSEFFDFENLPMLSRVVSLTLEIVKNVDRDVEVRKLALEVLGKTVRHCPREKMPTLQLIASGVLGGLMKVAKASTVNFKLLENTILLLGDTIVAVFGDDAVKFDVEKLDMKKYDERLHVIFQSQTAEWKETAVSTIHDYVKELLSSYLGHRVNMVKWNVCEMVCKVQSECSNFLGSVLHDCVLFMYTHFRYDESASYQDLAHTCLKLVGDKFVIEQYFYKQLESTIRKLPIETRAGHGDSEMRKLAAILDGLGVAVSLMCSTGSSTMENVLGCLADSIVIDKKGLLITSEGVSDSLKRELRKFKLKFGLSHKSVKLISEVLVRLGKLEIIDMVRNLMEQDSLSRKATYHIILAYMLAELEKTENIIDDPVILMLAEYLVQDVSDACPVIIEEDSSPGYSMKEHSWETCIECLSCTNVALCMRFMEKDINRANVSISCLCAILNQTCSRTWVVAESASFALTVMADNDENVKDVNQFVQAYSSHVLNSVSLACASSDEYLTAPQLLRGFMEFAEIREHFDQFKVIIEKLLRALDTNEQEYTYSLLQAVLSFIAALAQQYDDLQPIEPPEDSEDQKEIATPQHVLTEKILLRTKHMLISPHLPIKLLTLEILLHGLELLKNYDDALLPMIHQNWYGLMTIVKEQEPVSLRQIINIVVEMAHKSGSFVHGKVLQEFWPVTQQYVSRIVKLERIHQYGADYLLALRMIEKVPKLIEFLQLSEKEANEHFMPFLELTISQSTHFSLFASLQKEKVGKHFKNLQNAGQER